MRKEFPSLLALAESQGGVVTRRQALVHGASYETQRLRLHTGEWSERFGCLVLTRPPLGDDWIDASALALRLGREAVITGPLALRVGRVPVALRLPMVVIPSRHTRIDGVRVLRDTAPRATGGTRDFTYARVADALVDTLLAIPENAAKDLLDRALQLHWISVTRLEEILIARRRVGRRGVLALERLHRWAQHGTRSEAERRALPLLRRVPGVRWVANHPIVLHGRVVAEADFAVPELRLCIEIDGRAHHSDRLAFERDRARQNRLVLAGWTVLRFTWEQITADPKDLIEQVTRAVAACQSRGAVGCEG